MRVLLVTPPGRFPTVSHDPGRWWSAVAAKHDLRRYSANYVWWKDLCEGSPAAQGLIAFQDATTFASLPAYLRAVGLVRRRLDQFNIRGGDLFVDLSTGPGFGSVNYGSSHDLVEAARSEAARGGALPASFRGACGSEPDVALFTATSPQDLLTAAAGAFHLKDRLPGIYCALIDHGYENFTLRPHIESLARTGHLLDPFDAVVAATNDRDRLVPSIVEAVAAGRRPRGFLAAPTEIALGAGGAHVVPPPVPAFTPEPITWTRVSDRRCYWNRCAFCVQNVKYDDPSPPEIAEAAGCAARMRALARTGQRLVIFADEALSPSMLRHLSSSLSGAGIRWACRSKLEAAHDVALFQAVREAGCFEVLFGLESISPQVQRRMDKFTPAVDEHAVRRILQAMGDAGVGVHLNLLAGFPGDSVAALDETTTFAVQALRRVSGATFTLNRFALFPGTPVFLRAAEFGLVPHDTGDDMPADFAFGIDEEVNPGLIDVYDAAAGAERRLCDELGWEALLDDPAGAAALSLYFGSGHGAVFKAAHTNVFERARQVAA